MKCPVCGSAELETGSKDVPYTFRGQTTLLRNVRGQHCPACGETVMTRQESEAYTGKIKTFKSTLALNMG